MTPVSQGIYRKFHNSCLDPSAVGIVAGSNDSMFAATPKDATVVAWAESYGIHFCTIGDGDTIFMVEPGANEDQVVPVAANLLQFFGLLVACKHVRLLWQAQEQTKEDFSAALASEKPGMKQRSVLRALTNIYNPPVIQDPYRYMENIRRQST